MTWMNEWDVRDATSRFGTGRTPNLSDGALILYQLVGFTNRNSDGWPYWNPPSNAAKRLMELLESADRYEPVDVTEAELDKALRPIKGFLTRLNQTPYPYGGTVELAENATTLRTWIETYLKTARNDLARRLI